ncbi:hypothetical protein AAH446_06045 [Erwinia sp. P6884]|uniref:hypothetical protein n=1 Tax=Erwinia sp. P6884 TaxID=3141450 RepID=UPI0031987B7D
MLIWNDFIEMLGCSKHDEKFINLSSYFNELPSLDDGMLGDRNYYSFLKSGVLFLLENEVVEQISLYIQPGEGFNVYEGELPIPVDGSESEITKILGCPSTSGGWKIDMPLGYTNRWVKYEKRSYALHLQFSRNNKLCRVTIIK